MASKRSSAEDRSRKRSTLGEETRALVRGRIVRGAAAALAMHGFAATTDDIATAAGVGRRTVFRHFATHEAVVEAAVSEITSELEREIPKAPAPGVELQAWVEETAITMHDLNTRLIGNAFWDMNVERPGYSPALRDERRRRYSTAAAQGAWGLAGGNGRPPSWVVDAFALQLSGFATHCLEGYSAKRAGQVSARILLAVLASAIAEDRDRSSNKRKAIT